MVHDPNFPANDSFLADFPPAMRAEILAIINDAIVNALSVQGLTPGNTAGKIPINNGTLCAGLNAEKLGGNLASAFAVSSHAHAVATGSANGFLSNTDFTKLSGVATGAEVNQNAFSNILVNGITIQADSKTDTLELTAGSNITLTPDATNDRVTIAVSGTVPSATTATTAGTCTGNSATATSASNLTGGNITGAMVVPTANRDIGIFGTYDSTKTQHIWSMGTAYKNAADGSSFGNLYGLAYKYNGSAGGHGVYLVNNGTAYCGLGTNLWTSGYVYEAGARLDTRYLGIGANAVSATTATTATTATNATKLGGYSPASTNTVNTVALRDTSGDLVARLHRTEYSTTTGWNGAYVLGQNAVGSGVDNYARPIPLSTLISELNIPSVSASVSILTGTIAHGGTIPLPSGYTEAQCKWMVSMHSNIELIAYATRCYTSTSRVVTAQSYNHYYNGDNEYTNWGSATANYMIIGVK